MKLSNAFNDLSKRKKIQVSLFIIIMVILIGFVIWRVIGLLAYEIPIINQATIISDDGTGPQAVASNTVQTEVTPLGQPEEPGDTPGTIDRIIEGIKAAPTGTALSIGLIVVVILLAIASIIYLKRSKPKEDSADNK